jgi:hypothetical protein
VTGYGSFNPGRAGRHLHRLRGARCSRAALAALLAVCSAACAQLPVPNRPASAALYRDLHRLVTLAETAGWEIDRVEADDILADALMSVCQVPAAERDDLLAWLDQRIRHQGGPAEVAYRQHGRSLAELGDVLALERVRLVLVRAIAAAEQDCPFWLSPRPDFRGLQLVDDRWLVSFGGGGQGIVAVRKGVTDLSAGGAGRVMLGRAVGRRWTGLAGLEFGGTASFPRDEAPNGGRGSLVFGVDVVAPLAVRYRRVNTYLEIDAGPVWHFTEESAGGAPGVKVGASFAGRAARRRWFLPGAAFGLSVQRVFADGAQPAVTFVKVGFRVAIDITR